jgi:DNA-binding transcriptional MerR regulator
MDKSTYAIGEISRLVNLSQRTIRYYEEIGLLQSVRRFEHGKRVFTDDDVRRLKFINRLKVLGLSLSEMVALEKIYRKQQNNREILPKLLDILEERAAQIDERIAQLDALKKEIREHQEHLRRKFRQGGDLPGQHAYRKETHP